MKASVLKARLNTPLSLIKCVFFTLLTAFLIYAQNDSPHSKPGLYADGQFQGEMELMDAIKWIDRNVSRGGNYTIVLGAHERGSRISLDYGNTEVKVTIKAVGGERMIRYAEEPSAPLFTIGQGVTLVLEDNVALVGQQRGKSHPLVRIEGGTFDMNGGSIRGNSSSGVDVITGAFNMAGGEISGNSTTDGGGGVTMKGGTFTMSGGVISDNTKDGGGGGGIDVAAGIFEMSGGTISGNTASGVGGGVCVCEHGKFTMRGGTIHRNRSEIGGGVSISEGAFTMYNGTISENISGVAGGVFVGEKGAIFTMHGGSIIRNKASHSGGGVVVDVSTKYATITGGQNVGGGLMIHDGSGMNYLRGIFTMKNGTISENSAGERGGGVFCGGTFIMENGVISGNSAIEGGGVRVVDVRFQAYGAVRSTNPIFRKTGGTIYGSNASGGQANRAERGPAVLSGKFDRNGNGFIYLRNTTAEMWQRLDNRASGANGGWESSQMNNPAPQQGGGRPTSQQNRYNQPRGGRR
jgi:hypothetical protein